MTDVLIVGAGSAGSVLAERLSADPDRRVVVLEAGPSRADPAIRAITDPAAVLPIGPDSPVARRYRAMLTDTRPGEIVRGACVGGSGAINGGYFWRARPEDFGEVSGWSWDDVEPHFRVVEQRVGLSMQREFASSTAAFAAAVAAAGLTVTKVPLNIAGGVRRGPGAVFLEPALARPNLTVLTGTRVTRLTMTGRRVTGADTVGPHGAVHIGADRVVLCAGAIESAHLLMLSGIGPADALAPLGIPVIADLPVGQAFGDHPEWVTDTAWPAVDGHPVLEAVLVTESHEIRPYTTGFGAARTTLGVALMRPRSRGRLDLVSADPTVAPRITHRYDSEPADLAELQRGWEVLAELGIGGTPAWSTSQHLCATAPMGSGADAVVDPRCRVHGIEGLRVIDGSVLPRIPSRGPHATIVMLAHRAAEFF